MPSFNYLMHESCKELTVVMRGFVDLEDCPILIQAVEESTDRYPEVRDGWKLVIDLDSAILDSVAVGELRRIEAKAAKDGFKFSIKAFGKVVGDTASFLSLSARSALN